jgi:hypothetical protein
MLGRVALVRTDVSEELSASFIRGTRISELGTTLSVTGNRLTLTRKQNLSENASVSFFSLWEGVTYSVGSLRKS